MRRYLSMLFVLIVLVGCRLNTALPYPTESKSPEQVNVPTILPPTNTSTPFSSPTPSQTPTLHPTITPSLTSTPTRIEAGFEVEYHPDAPLYSGDRVSISVISPAEMSMDGATLSIEIEQPEPLILGPTEFGEWGIGGRSQATLIWGWDTVGIAAGDYILNYSIEPFGITFTDVISLLPASSMPSYETNAQWAEARTDCCVVHYITNTAAARDIDALLAMVDQQADHAVQVMGIEFTEPIIITILPRVMGHGGFASDEISVSYLDRNYAANSWDMVVHHEMVHILDARLGGDLRPSILVEGLAVYMSGGHYKPEELLPRAATLLEKANNQFVSLDLLTDDFYAAQHEIGYLEAGALVEYLVNTYSWEMFSSFYRDIHPAASGKQSDALESALQTHFGQSLEQLEHAFISYLQLQAYTDEWQEDVRLTVSYFDTLRRYQEQLDRSAYFRTAWLLDGRSLRANGIVADWLRHPREPINLALETLLISASDAMVNRDPGSATTLLQIMNQILDAIEQSRPEPFEVHPLAADYLAIATTLLQSGYELQSVEINDDTASVLVTGDGYDLLELQMIRVAGFWQLK